MNSDLLSRARSMRHQATEAERRMWTVLRSRRFSGYKFRRQVPIDRYIVDFLCPARRLVIEIDGSQHLGDVAYDSRRTDALARLGYRTLRFWNNEVMSDLRAVGERIWVELNYGR